jgi:carbamoyl-phosphate synthase large subunit
MGFTLHATDGTARYLKGRGIPARTVRKVHEGRPNGIDLMVNGEVQLLINTPLGKHAQHDDYLLRRTAIAQRVSYTTTMSAARAACDAILALRSRRASVRSLQEWHQDGRAARDLTGGTEPGAPADVPAAPDPRSGGRATPRLASREASP